MDTRLIKSMINRLKKETESLIKKRSIEDNKLKAIQHTIEEYDYIIQDNLDRIVLLEAKTPQQEEDINETTEIENGFQPDIENFIEQTNTDPDNIFQGKLFNN